MNERIKELAEKYGSTHKQSLGVYQFFEQELQEFAESIIRECCDIVATSNEPNKCAYTSWDLGTVRCAVQKAEEAVCDHFNLTKPFRS